MATWDMFHKISCNWVGSATTTGNNSGWVNVDYYSQQMDSPPSIEEDPFAWLDRRIEEMRVRL